MAIVVGTDFSADSLQAADAAAAIAGVVGERVVLLHVARPGSMQESSRERLATEAARLTRTGVGVEPVLAEGHPDEVVVERADRARAQLIAVGALGSRSGSRWRIGSVADRIAQTCTCPLLIVRSAAPFVAWSRKERALRVTAGDDLSAVSDAALRFIGVLRKIGHVDATVAHVYWVPGEYARVGYGLERRAELESLVEREVQKHADACGVSAASTRIASSYGRIADPLIALAADAGADLVLVGAHQRKGARRAWYGSVSQTVTHLAPMSVALVPAAELLDSVPAPVAPVATVLVSTDFSAIGNRAIAHACSILAPGGLVILTHVIDSPGLVYERDWADRGSRSVPGTEEEGAAKRRLDALIPPDAAARGIAFRTEVLFGLKVADAICQAAERHGVDVICIGSHGRSGAARLLLGSVAREVIDRSRKPVFLVKAAQS